LLMRFADPRCEESLEIRIRSLGHDAVILIIN
jgi:hypothetical protein